MAVDLFQQAGINPNANAQSIDLFQQAGIDPGVADAQTISPFMSGVAGFNKQYETLPANIAVGMDKLAHLIDPNSTPDNTQNINNFYNDRAQQYQQIVNENPISGRVGKVIGDIAASLPAYVAAGVKIPSNFAAGAWTGYSQSNPNSSAYEKLFNAAAGGTTSAALSLIPFGLGRATNGLQTQEYAQNILKNLSGGNSIEENGKSLAKDLQDAFNQKQAEAKALYSPVFDQYGENNIYPLVNPKANSQYLNLDPDITDNFNNRSITSLHKTFMDSPTFQNAHNLQSQLGTAIRSIQNAQLKSGGSVADNLTLQGYQEARNALKSDMGSFLDNVNPQAASQYNLASQHFAQNVTPYLANPKLAQIAQGEITNPKTVTSLFQNPEPEMQQIVEDMGSGAANKILYSLLGKTQNNLTPQNLINAFNSLDKNGLSSYITPDLANQIQTLAAKTSSKNNTQNILGAAIGSHFGGVPGAAAGAWLTPKLAQALNSPLASTLLKGIRKGTTVLPATVTPSGMPLSDNLSNTYFNSQGGL
jgi:hypothetical protein